MQLTHYPSAAGHLPQAPTPLTAQAALTLGGHGPTVDAAPQAGRAAEGWGPAPEAVAVLVVIADLEREAGGVSFQGSPAPTASGAQEPRSPGTYPMAVALLPAAFRFKEGGVPAVTLEANLS